MSTYFIVGRYEKNGGCAELFASREDAEKVQRDMHRTLDYELWEAEGNPPEIERLARIEADRTDETLKTIREITIDAELLHQWDSYSLWSDSRVRKAKVVEVYLHVGEPTTSSPSPAWKGQQVRPRFSTRGLKPNKLPPAAASLLSAYLGSDSKSTETTEWIGHVRDVLEEKEIQIGGDRGEWARRTITRYRLKLDTGAVKTTFVFSVGYSEGYAFDFCDTWAEAKKEFAPPPCPLLECLECGAAYEKPGHVEWGGMGCDRCG